MQELFLGLLRLSLTGSVFALAVMAVRLLLRKAPKWLLCLLWGVVALRLICPISMESSFSLMPDALSSGQILQDVGSNYVGEVEILYETNAGYSNAIEAGRQPIYSPGGYYVEIEKDSLEAPKTVENTVYPILSWIWLAGMLGMLAYTAVSYLALKLETGRTHQIRVQFSHRKMPLVGDGRYGGRERVPIALRSAHTVFKHPFTKKKIELFCLPDASSEPWSLLEAQLCEDIFAES
jgi:beta-lactamase regulating signal transducer with metallopeptidase domain